ncbi:hypothetical protein [Sphingomonas sp.]|uniref:hypothetical protein n=1 Tax=Sphingomonas sp. TaxID=28214 RepID=UPI0025CDC396|nr:hypothetical protein [Sphingomonas sp.]MBV9526774.1 DUF2059 domain-containing protein [Sphingomonas sp.]
MRALILGASLLALSTASAAAVPHKKAAGHSSATKAPFVSHPVPDMSAIFAMFDKLFPPQPDPDPARLALSRTTAASIWPTGAYGNMMSGMIGNVFDRAMQLKQSDLPGATKTAAADSNLSLHDLAAKKDPYFDQRAAAIRQVIVDETAQVSAILDPRIREGLARAMARRFDERQLADINAFFATPSGHALASQYMQLWVDPDTMRAIFGSMPEMMKLTPDMMQKMKAAADKYPSPPKAAPAHAKS